ncbi:MAG: hypothetical protein HY259_15135 [Chloroflexi bacterium]|nr:hypothetical protein [Chloroflexota bacterium]
MKRKIILASMTLAAILFAAVALSLPPAAGAQGTPVISCQVNIYTETISIAQTGVNLSTTIRVPKAQIDSAQPYYCPPLANHKWPMIITMHGIGQDRSNVDAIAASNAQSLAVIAVDFDWRGHGASSGFFDWSVSGEWDDLRRLTNYLIDTYQNTAGKIDSTRLGIEGRSLGSEHTEMAAARSWTWEYPYTSAVAFDNSSFPELHDAVNGCLNNSASQWLPSAITTINWLTGTDTTLRSYYANNNVLSWTNYFSDTSRNWSQYLNTITTTRLFEQVSWTDLIQYPNQSFDVFHINPSPLSPSQTKRLYMAANGHEEFLVFADVYLQKIADRRGWHQTWLRDRPALDGGAVTYLEYLPGDPTVITNHVIITNSNDWPPTGAATLTVYLRDNHKLTVGKPKPAQDNGFEIITNTFTDAASAYTPLVALGESPSYTSYPTYFVTTTAVFTTNILSQTVHWLGAPDIHYFTSADSRPYHLQAQFFDVTPGGPEALITRANSCWGTDATADPANRTVTGLSHARLITTGHQIKVVFSDVDLETSAPISTTLLRMRPVFGNYTAHISHTAFLSTSITLWLSPTVGIFQDDPEAFNWGGDGVPDAPVVALAEGGVGPTRDDNPLGGSAGLGLSPPFHFTAYGRDSVTIAPQTPRLAVPGPTVSIEALYLPEQPNGDTWYASVVEVQFFCQPGAAPLVRCPGTVWLKTDGPNQTVTGTAVDALGNTATLTVGPFNIDRTPPVITGPGVLTASGCGTANYAVQYGATDALSGVAHVEATLNGAVVTSGDVVSLPVGDSALVVTAGDGAGNQSTQTFNLKCS